MRVLWFTTTPANAASRIGFSHKGRGWISSLQDVVAAQPGVSLGLCFFYEGNKDMEFEEEGTRYYGIGLPKKSVAGRILDRYRTVLPSNYRINGLLNVINTFKPDVIHVFGSEDVFGMVSKYVTIPVIIHIQGILNPYLDNWFPRGVSNWQVLCKTPLSETLRGTGLYFEYQFMKKMAKREKAILQYCNFFMGRTTWDKAVTRFLSPGSQYFHCEEMIRPAFWEHQWRLTQRNKIILTTTINPNIYKGLDIVLKTARLLKNHPEVDFEWRIFGIHSNQEIVRFFEKLAKDRFSSCNVVFMGPTDSDKLVNYLLETSVFVHPSHIDNSPNSVCEAMLLGVPVIAAQVGGVSSMLQDGVEGILYPDNDPYLLAHQILELAGNEEKRKTIGAAARHRALMRHDKTAILESLLDIYKSISVKPNLTDA